MRADPMFRDVTSDSQLKGLQAQLEHRPRQGQHRSACTIDDIRTALYSAFGERQVSTIYTAVDSYQVILEVAPTATKQDESAFDKIYVRGKSGALVPLSSFATVERTVGPTVDQPRGPAAGDHGVVQPRARTRRWATRPTKIEQYREQIRACRPSIITSYGGDAAVFKSSQGSQAILIVSALLVIYVLLGVLYESYIHPLTILAGLPSAAVGALLTLRAVRPGPDADRDHRHPAADRHREEERDHDDRLRARRAAQRRAWRRRRRSARRACCASGRS